MTTEDYDATLELGGGEARALMERAERIHRNIVETGDLDASDVDHLIEYERRFSPHSVIMLALLRKLAKMFAEQRFRDYRRSP